MRRPKAKFNCIVGFTGYAYTVSNNTGEQLELLHAEIVNGMNGQGAALGIQKSSAAAVGGTIGGGLILGLVTFGITFLVALVASPAPDGNPEASIRLKQSEENARIVLRDLFREELISSFRPTKQGSVDELHGIAFYFSINIKGKRVEIPLQVKSSWAGVKSHNSHYGDIHCVNGQSPHLSQQIENIIYDYQSKLGGKKKK